jgi:hypothetical protein
MLVDARCPEACPNCDGSSYKVESSKCIFTERCLHYSGNLRCLLYVARSATYNKHLKIVHPLAVEAISGGKT